MKHFFVCAHTKIMGRLNGQINLIIWPGGVKGGAELRGTFNEPIEGIRESFFVCTGVPKLLQNDENPYKTLRFLTFLVLRVTPTKTTCAHKEKWGLLNVRINSAAGSPISS